MKFPLTGPINPVHNNQRDGHMRQTINTDRISYEPNTIGGEVVLSRRKPAEGGFTSL